MKHLYRVTEKSFTEVSPRIEQPISGSASSLYALIKPIVPFVGFYFVTLQLRVFILLYTALDKAVRLG